MNAVRTQKKVMCCDKTCPHMKQCSKYQTDPLAKKFKKIQTVPTLSTLCEDGRSTYGCFTPIR